MKAGKIPLAKSISESFTLVEVLVVIVIFSLLTIVVGRFLVVFFNLKYNAETVQRLRQEGNLALDQIDYLVRNSLTLPDICVGRIPPDKPPDGFLLHRDLKDVVDTCGSNELISPTVITGTTIPIDKAKIYERPLHCEFDPVEDKPNYKSSFEYAYGFCKSKCHVYRELRTNTQGETEGAYFVRNLVALADCSDSSVQCKEITSPNQPAGLYLWRSFEPNVKHNTFGEFKSKAKYSSLTNFRSEPGGSPFRVKDLAFFCFFDYFSNSYVVSTSFEIVYERLALSGRAQRNAAEISEKFHRYSVVRNPYPFEY